MPSAPTTPSPCRAGAHSPPPGARRPQSTTTAGPSRLPSHISIATNTIPTQAVATLQINRTPTCRVTSAISDTDHQCRSDLHLNQIGRLAATPSQVGILNTVACSGAILGRPGSAFGESRRTHPPATDRLLAAVDAAHEHIDLTEADLLRRARAAGLTWREIARAMGLGSPQAASQRATGGATTDSTASATSSPRRRPPTGTEVVTAQAPGLTARSISSTAPGRSGSDPARAPRRSPPPGSARTARGRRSSGCRC